MAFRELERVETRALGALRYVDAATGAVITTPMRLGVDGHARFVRNRGGLDVISFWSPLAAHEQAFAEPPAEPATGSLDMTLAVSDPSGRYLPRRVTVRLPRDPDPAGGGAADSLFRPVDVAMYPAPRAATGANWSVLRVSVTDGGSGDVLGGALLRVQRNGDVLARALTDGRGEGLVALVGIPMVTFGEDDDAVVVDAVNVTLTAVFDPEQGTRLTAAALSAGANAPAPLVDPDALEADAETLPSEELALSVAARRGQSVAVTLDLP